MIDILLFLFQNYTDFAAHPQGEALTRKLTAVGFEAEEVSVAVDWLTALREEPATAFTCAPGAFRVYTADELRCLGDECLAFLAFLERAGAVTPVVRELIVGRAVALGEEPLPLEQFKVIVLMVLWSRDQELDPLIVEELLADDADATLH